MLKRILSSPTVRFFAAVLAGMIANAAFAPIGLFPIAFIALAALFLLWEKSTPAFNALLGLGFGIGLFCVGISWVYTSVHDFGYASVAFSVAAVVALATSQAAFISICGYLQSRLRVSRPVRYLAWLPAVWVLTEWIRGWFLTGFPWLYLGYTQTDTLLSGIATYTGVLGVSLAVCICTGAVILLFSRERKQMVIGGSVLAVVWLIGGVGGIVQWTEPVRHKIDIGLIQGNVSIDEKWDNAKARVHFQNYLDLSDQLNDRDLIVWPESALAYTSRQLEGSALWERLRKHPADFLIGLIEGRQIGKEWAYYNSVYSVSDENRIYRKRHLVPFGEYTPFRSVLNFLADFVEIPMSDMLPYEEQQLPLKVAGQLAGVSICYEDAFTQEVLSMLPAATFLVNVSEDAWFGSKLAPYQRVQMSRMRAIETGRPVVRVANRGISASIDHQGNIIDQLSQHEGNVLMTAIQPMKGVTPFVYAGNYPVLAICGALIIFSIVSAARFFKEE